MQKRNFGQAKRAKETARKERQQKKLDRRHSRTVEPVEETQPAPAADTDQKPSP
jgi:hypothetical protein